LPDLRQVCKHYTHRQPKTLLLPSSGPLQPEDGGSVTLQNIAILTHHYMASQRTRTRIESSLP